jgi:DNA-binding MarR family transcriptional regulator
VVANFLIFPKKIVSLPEKRINMDNSEKVLKALKDSAKPLKAGDIATTSGIDKAEVDKLIKKLVKEDKVFSPIRCFYQSR